MNDTLSGQLQLLPSLESNSLCTFIVHGDTYYWNRFFAYDTSYHFAKLSDSFEEKMKYLRGRGKLLNN